MFCFGCGAAAASFLRDVYSKIVIFQKKNVHLRCLQTAFSQSQCHKYLYLTHLNKYFKCSLCYDTSIIQIDLVDAETQNRGKFLTD